jgi:pimeloyl-ACP methyl ester carboxylesterase
LDTEVSRSSTRLVTNGFAAEHDVILVDYPGIGRSSGETPSTVAALTNHCVAFCRTIDLTHFGVVGFSLGGAIAQQLGAEYPDMVRRIILLGSGPQGGEGMVVGDLSVDDLDHVPALLMKAFFTPSEASQAAGRAYVERLNHEKPSRDSQMASRCGPVESEAVSGIVRSHPCRTDGRPHRQDRPVRSRR